MDRVMNSLFPLILFVAGFYLLQMNSYVTPLSAYVLCAIPAGWVLLRKIRGQKTEIDRLLHEVRESQMNDKVFFSFLFVKLFLKLAASFFIGIFAFPYYFMNLVASIVSVFKKRKRVYFHDSM